MAAVMMEPLTPLRHAHADIPEAFAALVSRCLEKDRNQRCANVAEVAYGLAQFCPPRTRPLVDRIAMILRVSPPSVSIEVSTFAANVQVASRVSLPQASYPVSQPQGSSLDLQPQPSFFAAPAFAGTTGATVKPGETASRGSSPWRIAAFLAVPLAIAGALAGWRAAHGKPAPQPSSTPPATTSSESAVAVAVASIAPEPDPVAPAPLTARPSSLAIEDARAPKPAPKPAGNRRVESPQSTESPSFATSPAPVVSATPRPAPKQPGLLDNSH